MNKDFNLLESLTIFVFLGLMSFTTMSAFDLFPDSNGNFFTAQVKPTTETIEINAKKNYLPQRNQESQTRTAECSDGQDNDGDGRKDFPDDPGCLSPNQNSESQQPIVDFIPTNDPAPIIVGTIAAGSRVTRTINVQHSSTIPATQINFSATAPFSIMNHSCPAVLTTNCTVTIGYIPTTIAPNNQTGTITATYKNNGSTQSVSKNLIGTGTTNDFGKVLIVYNENSPESIALKNYYLSHRPGAAAANVLGIHTTDGENISSTDFETTIRNPIYAWMQANAGRGVKYIILMRGIPSRFSGYPAFNAPINTIKSVQTRIADTKRELGVVPQSAPTYYNSSNPPFNPLVHTGTMALVTHMDMGSEAATRAYIDKLADVHSRMATPNAIISGENAGILGTTYYCEDSSSIAAGATIAAELCNNVHTTYPNIPVQIRAYAEPAFTNISNVRGFMTWGQNGRTPNRNPYYAVDGEITFSGNSKWYVVESIESWNGIQHQNQPGYQGNFEDWFSEHAFGSTNYDFTPVGVVGHTHEPGLTGINTNKYFRYWESGQNFIETAWATRVTPVFRATGDPLVKK